MIAALARALGRPDLDGHYRFHTRFGGVRTAVVWLADADASRLLQLGRVRVGWVISEQYKWSENSAWYQDPS